MRQALLDITIPMRLPSRANFRGHTRSRKHTKMVREQRGVTRLVLSARAERRPKLPCVICLTRIAPRSLDHADNLPMSMKSVRDGIADWLGVDDRSDQIQWQYDQRKGSGPRVNELQVEVFENEDPWGCKLCGAGFGVVPCPHRSTFAEAP